MEKLHECSPLFETANQLLTSHSFHLAPWMNGNLFYFCEMNLVDFFLLVRCWYNKQIHGSSEIWNFSFRVFDSISNKWVQWVEHSKRNSVSPHIHVLFSIQYSSININLLLFACDYLLVVHCSETGQLPHTILLIWIHCRNIK